MLLIKIVGTLVATQKDENLKGAKLLIGKEIELDGTLTESYHVCVDTVGAGENEVVVVVRGSGARMTKFTGDKPIDTAIIAIVDEIEVNRNIVWKKD